MWIKKDISLQKLHIKLIKLTSIYLPDAFA